MKGFLLLLTGLAIILLSCSSEEREKKKEVRLKQKAFLFNMQHLYTDAEFDVSFPCWFNDSIIRKKGISGLIRSTYRLTDDEEGGEDIREIKRYSFDRNGHVTRYEVEQFYDNIRIGSMAFKYVKTRDEYGFAEVKVDPLFGDLGGENYYQRYKKEQYSEKFLVYVNGDKGNYLFCLLNPKYWGSVSVDTIASPTPDDIIIYGSPERPEKKFQVRNKVNEFNITKVAYNRKFGFAEKIEFDKYPFRNKRSLKYQKNGNFESFIDSTFSGEQFLNRSVSRMSFDKNMLPEFLRRDFYKEGESGGYSEIERFTYEYYQD